MKGEREIDRNAHVTRRTHTEGCMRAEVQGQIQGEGAQNPNFSSVGCVSEFQSWDRTSGIPFPDLP